MTITVGTDKFNRDLKKFAREVDEDYNTLFRKVVVAIFSGIVKKTPVDVGTARSNWQVAINTKLWTEVAAEPAGRTLARGIGEAGGARMGDTAYILNGLPYIEPLENGSSTQAANGMIDLTLAEVYQGPLFRR